MFERAFTTYPCRDLDATVGFFLNLGFVVDSVQPADNPTIIEVSGFGTRLRLERRADGTAPEMVLTSTDDGAIDADLTAPDGGKVRFILADPPVARPPVSPTIVVTHQRGADDFGIGRAGMQYRDLIPDRQGGRFIASHIRIPVGGPVPDSVHYHRIAFQMLYVVRGWVEVVYEDRGEPFVMHPGDAVLQPPEIRHRVLASSDAFEIIEIGDPAEHQTLMDHELELPTECRAPDRRFAGQRFHQYVATSAQWSPSTPGWEQRDLGIEAASSGAGAAIVLRATDIGQATTVGVHDHQLHFTFVLDGEAVVTIDGVDHEVATGSAVTIPAATSFRWSDTSADLVMLRVTI